MRSSASSLYVGNWRPTWATSDLVKKEKEGKKRDEGRKEKLRGHEKRKKPQPVLASFIST